MGGQGARSSWAISRRERLELTVTALLPAAVGMISEPVRWAGRAAWLAPWLALPAGLLLCRVWSELGGQSRGLIGITEAVSRPFGKVMEALYLIWGLFLLSRSAQRCADRLQAAGQIRTSGWLILLAMLLLILWLSENGRMTGAGRIFYLSTTAVLILAGFLTLPSLRWENLLPVVEADRTGGGVLRAALWSLSLAGYMIYLLWVPQRQGEDGQSGAAGWVLWPTAALSMVLAAAVGSFGPALLLKLDEPFLYILKGVGVPGAFQRGEAILAAVLAFSDLVLLGILTQGCIRLWSVLRPDGTHGGKLLVAGMFLLAALTEREIGEVGELMGKIEMTGNVILGFILPLFLHRTLKKKH